MTAKEARALNPCASFVVERRGGEGYRVVWADGARADEWRSRALALLDVLGQPDPAGSEERFRWLGPIAPTGEFVGVVVKCLPNGEARYHQAWFQIPGRPGKLGLRVALLTASLLIVFAMGALAGRAFDRRGAEPVTAPAPVVVQPPMNDVVSAEELNAARLMQELRRSRGVREKLKRYLSQEGLAADKSVPVVEERRAVKLIADLDKAPPSQESMRLSNIDVEKVLALMEAIENWSAALGDQPSSREDEGKP